jgi:glycosyltransferase involved in cell wall biosynthesis
VQQLRASVVVSTYNRPVRLKLLLDGIRAQTVPTSQFEAIVVDNGSRPETGAALAAEQARGGLPLRVVRHERTRGPAGGRNSGWRIARGRLIAFTDDDCVPQPGWLAAALELFERNPSAIFQGRTIPDPSELANDGMLSRSQRIERLGPYYETCNVFYPYEVLERLGGLDESFGLQPAGEDTDLAWRAINSGSEPIFVPDALVYHAVERLGVRGMLRVAARWSAAVRVYGDNPQVRAGLYRGVFWDPYHYLMWRSLLALAAPAWLRRMLLMRHLGELRGRARTFGSAPWWAVPYLFIHDAVECCAIARGAVRHRTLVL